MSSDCLFCQIVAGTIPAAVVHRDEAVTAFRDIQPQAPVHVLIVPNAHVGSLTEAAGDAATLGALLQAAARIAAQEGIADGGYRVVVNTGQDGGQSVAHLHLHLLGGRALGPSSSPPGTPTGH